MPAWYPLKLTCHVRTYAFGERLIPERLGKEGVPATGRVSETWEVSGYEETTGTITNGAGAFAGRSLNDLVRSHPHELVGPGWLGDRFPLLLKLLDASHALPVHLHADDETARRVYGAPNGKTEAWHILWAAPGATILAGIKEGVTREELARALKAQDYDAVMPRHAIAAGDTVYVPGGVLHSFGPNTLITEIQQTSDLTRHVMPADLYGRELPEAEWDANIEAALDELRMDWRPRPHPGLAVEQDGNRYVYGAAGPYFALQRWSLREPHRGTTEGGCLTVTNLGAPVRIASEAGTEVLERATSCILPAALGAYEIVPDGESPADLVVCRVPDLQRDVVAPLREAGYGDAEIAALGEVGI